MQRTTAVAVVLTAILFAATESPAQQQDTVRARPPAPVPGEVLVTQPGYVACLERDRFHEIMEKAANDDLDGVTAMLDDRSTGCFRLKGGLSVTLLANVVLFVQVRPEVAEERPFWTVVEAVARPERPAAERVAGADA